MDSRLVDVLVNKSRHARKRSIHPVVTDVGLAPPLKGKIIALIVGSEGGCPCSSQPARCREPDTSI